MRWVIRLTNRAERARGRIPARDRRRVDAALLEMEEDPFSGDITMLRGSYQRSYRRRVGNWRVIFTLHPNQEPRTVDINDIRRRTTTAYSRNPHVVLSAAARDSPAYDPLVSLQGFTRRASLNRAKSVSVRPL